MAGGSIKPGLRAKTLQHQQLALASSCNGDEKANVGAMESESRTNFASAFAHDHDGCLRECYDRLGLRVGKIIANCQRNFSNPQNRRNTKFAMLTANGRIFAAVAPNPACPRMLS